MSGLVSGPGAADGRPTLASWYGYGHKSEGGGGSDRSGGPRLPPIGVERLVSAWLGGLSEETIRNYRADMTMFARFIKAPTGQDAGRHLISLSNGEANLIALDFRNDMLMRKLAPASVNRRMATLRSFTRAARKVGLIPWVLEVDPVFAKPYKDTRGPGTDGFRQMMAKLRLRTDAKGARDRAVLRLLYERALRAKEVQGLDLADVDLDRGRVFILGKWRREKEWVSVAPTTRDALSEWIAIRGNDPGPLFVRMQYAYGAGRITRQGIYRLVRELGEEVGIRARPHGLRHAGITAALDAGIDVRSVQRFARHMNLSTMMVYDDCRADLGGQVAHLIAEPEPGASKPKPPPLVRPPPPADSRTGVRVGKPPPTPHELSRQRGETSPNAKVTEDDVLEIRRRHAAGEGPVALAEAFGVSADNVRSIVKRQSWKHVGGELPKRQLRKAVRLTDDDVREIRRRRAAGEGPTALAAVFGVDPLYIGAIVARRARADVLDLVADEPAPTYERLTEDAVRELRRRSVAGETMRALAEAYGIDRNQVSAIVRGKAWKNVSDTPTAPTTAEPPVAPPQPSGQAADPGASSDSVEAQEPKDAPPTTIEEAMARGYTLYEWLLVAPGPRRRPRRERQAKASGASPVGGDGP